MQKNKINTAKLGVMFIVAAMALAGVGAGYSAWFDTITVHGTVSTGSVEWHFNDYSSTYVWKNLDTDVMEITGEGEIVYWNSLLVAYAKAYQGDDNHHAIVEFDNLFPDVDFEADVVITYTGTVPGKINDIIFTPLDDMEDLSPYTKLDVTIFDGSTIPVQVATFDETNWEGLFGFQLHEGYTIHVVMTINLEQDNTLMNMDGGFEVSAEVIQWNEYVPPAPPEPECLVSYWNLDEGTGTTAYDSADSNDGTVHGASWAPGEGINGCLNFDGSNDYVRVPDDNILDLTDEITIMAWIKPDTVYSGGNWRLDDPIVCKRYSYYLTIENQGRLQFYGYGLSPTILVGSDMTSYEDTWVHVAVTYDGSEIILYIDGSEDTSLSSTGNIDTASSPVTIGYVDNNRYFHGNIDEVKIYSCALTADEILAQYNAGL